LGKTKSRFLLNCPSRVQSQMSRHPRSCGQNTETICGELEKFDSGGMINRRGLKQMMANPMSQAVFQRLKINVVHMSALTLMLSCWGDQLITFTHPAESVTFTRWSIRSDALVVRIDANKAFNELKSKLDEVIRFHVTKSLDNYNDTFWLCSED